MVFPYLAALFIFLPMLELAVLFHVYGAVGLGPTLALILFTGVLGAYLARREGIKTLHAIRRETAMGRLPAAAMMDGILVLAAGIFLITPGMVTDAVGFLLLIPAVRTRIRSRLRKAIEIRLLKMR